MLAAPAPPRRVTGPPLPLIWAVCSLMDISARFGDVKRLASATWLLGCLGGVALGGVLCASPLARLPPLLLLPLAAAARAWNAKLSLPACTHCTGEAW